MHHRDKQAAVVGAGAPNLSQKRPLAAGEHCQGAVPPVQPHITPVPPCRPAPSSPWSSGYHPDAFTALQQETGMQAALRAARQQLLNHAVPGSAALPPTPASPWRSGRKRVVFPKASWSLRAPSLGDSYRREREREGLLHRHGMGWHPLLAHLQGFSST